MSSKQVTIAAAETALNAPTHRNTGPRKGQSDPTGQPPAEPEPSRGGNVPAVLKAPGKPELVQPGIPPAVREDQAERAGAVRPPASRSRLRSRHILVVFSFLLLVVGPTAVSAWYLWTRAADQFASYVGFSVRTEDVGSAINSILGPLSLGESSSAPDAEVLYQFIQSQDLADAVDKKLDLRGIWSKAGPDADPVFSYHPPGTIEDLLDHWERKVKVSYDRNTGLIELRVLAFTPGDAKAIAEEIFARSSEMIN